MVVNSPCFSKGLTMTQTSSFNADSSQALLASTVGGNVELLDSKKAL